MKLGKTRIDPDAVVQGTWTTFVIKRTGDEIKLKLALANTSINRQYQKALRDAFSTHRRAIEAFSDKNTEMPQKVVQKIQQVNREVFAQHIVLDWEGVEGDDGKPLAFSPAAAMKLFDEFPELYESAEEESKKVDRYRQEVLDAQAGNSSPA